MSYYSFLHKSIKWWCKVFWILEVAVLNAYIMLLQPHADIKSRERERDVCTIAVCVAHSL